MLSSTGETILAALGGVVAIIVGVAVWRYREPYHRLIVQWQHHALGERAGERATRRTSPSQVRLLGGAFIAFGALLVCISPWVSEF